MEKKKKRDKSALNNAESEGGDHQQKEAEHQVGVALVKRFFKVGSPLQENATGSHNQSPPILQWPYNPQHPHEQSLQFPGHSSLVQQSEGLARHQPQNQHQQQQHAHQGALQQGQQQPQPQPQPQQQTAPYWPHPEFPATGPPAGPFYPFPSGSGDANWQASAYTGAHAASDHATPYGYQGGYAYPVGYPGPWDPAAWWGHSHQQAPYPYPYPPYGGGYGYMAAPPVPPTVASAPNGACQRGIIRPPAGLSQKHQRLWEAQSMENVQLWGALARAEAEITAYRGRLMRLEAELYAMKTHHDAAVDGSTMATTALQATRKGRNKRSTAMTAAALPSSDNIQSRPRGRKISTTKMAEGKEKNDTEKDKESKPEAKGKVSAPMTDGPSNVPIAEEEQEKVPVIFNNGNDFELDKNKSRLASDFQTAVICHNHVFANNADNLQYSSINQISAFGNPVPIVERKENGNENTMDRKGSFAGPSQNLNNFIENKAQESGEEGSASYRGMNNRANGWAAAATTGDGARNLMLDTRLHPFYDHGNVMRSDTMHPGKIISPWGYVGEDASEEQDDVVPSGKEEDDEEMDEDADSALDEIRRPKAEGILRLDSASAIPKGLTQLNRW